MALTTEPSLPTYNATAKAAAVDPLAASQPAWPALLVAASSDMGMLARATVSELMVHRGESSVAMRTA